MGIRLPIKMSYKTNLTAARVFIFVSLAMTILAFIVVVFIGASGLIDKKEIVELSSITLSDMSEDNEYYFEDSMLVVDSYATLTNKSSFEVVKEYVLVAFLDKNDELYYASLEIKPSDDIYSKIVAYIYDDNATIGDLWISGCFSYKDPSSHEDSSASARLNSSKDYSAYNSAVRIYDELLNGNATEIRFTYDASDPEAFAKKETKEAWTFIIGGVVVSLVLIGFLIWLRVRID